MTLGRTVDVEDVGGGQQIVTHRLVPRERPDASGGDRALRSWKRHFTLSSAYAANNPLRIVANQPIVLPIGGGEFTKYRILIRNANADGFISLRGPADSIAGRYDDVSIGGAELNERCEPSSYFSIVFAVAPPDPVEIFLYAGDAAQPV